MRYIESIYIIEVLGNCNLLVSKPLHCIYIYIEVGNVDLQLRVCET